MVRQLQDSPQNGEAEKNIVGERENLHLLVNLLALQITVDMPLSEKAATLGDAGFSNGRIAGMFNTTADSIRSMRNQAKRANKIRAK
jgi:hypothetical protein